MLYIRLMSPFFAARYTPRMRSKTARFHDLTRPWEWDVSCFHFIYKTFLDVFLQYWIKNKGKKMPVVEPIKEEDWMWFRFIIE